VVAAEEEAEKAVSSGHVYAHIESIYTEKGK
jgi:hypothetical protein